MWNNKGAEYRKRNPSYPERMFIKFLDENGYSEKFYIEREYPVYPYFIDFAFVDLKLAIEIDGSQHLLPERKESDQKKEKLLFENGWKVLRFSEKIVKTDWDIIREKINEFLSPYSDVKFERVGILVHVAKKYIKVERGADGFSDKERESHKKLRKVERPDKETLSNLIRYNTWEKIAKDFNVSSNTIKKWAKQYNLPNSTYKKKGKKEKTVLVKKICPICGNEFMPESEKSVYCSVNCANKAKTILTVIINGKPETVTKDFLEREKTKYKTLKEMSENLGISRFSLARRFKMFDLRFK